MGFVILAYQIKLIVCHFNDSLSSNAPLQILFSDLWSPSPILSTDKKLYYWVFVDHYTKHIWLYTIENKSEASSIYEKFHPLVENYFKHKISSLYTDEEVNTQVLNTIYKSMTLTIQFPHPTHPNEFP